MEKKYELLIDFYFKGHYFKKEGKLTCDTDVCFFDNTEIFIKTDIVENNPSIFKLIEEPKSYVCTNKDGITCLLMDGTHIPRKDEEYNIWRSDHDFINITESHGNLGTSWEDTEPLEVEIIIKKK